jgi:glycosyltransferase involved in cell wall biosynthesis
MPQSPLSTESLAASPATRHDGSFIYIACPWTPVGGGMFKVCDYLLQSQSPHPAESAARLRPLDSRGGASALFSLWVLTVALAKILWGRIQGRLAGVHVNMGPRLSLFRKGLIVVTCRALGIPVVLHLHSQMRTFYQGLPAALQRLTRWVFSLADTVVVIGPVARRLVIEDLGVPPERVEIVINGVPAATEPRRKAEPGRVKRVLFLGNLSDQKGVMDLLRALARPGFDREGLEVTLGGGGDVAGYRARAQQLGVSDIVRLPGWCDQWETARLLAQADVLVLPSYDEVLPLVILEALANGVAVICTPLGEIPSLLTDGVHVLYVDPGDVDGLADALQEVLHQPELLETLEHNGLALYGRQFSLPRFFAAMARVHQRTFGVAGQPRESRGTAQERAR